MSTFPENPVPNYPLTITPRWQTLIKKSASGIEQRKQQQLYAQYDVNIQYSELSVASTQILWNFYMAAKGAYESFYIYDLSLLAGIQFGHVGLYVGTGDSLVEIFDIPGRSTSSHTVYIDAISKSDPSDYGILTGGGESASDRIEFTAPVPTGEIVTVDFTGYLRMRVRFAEDKLSRDLFNYNLFKYGINLIGLAPL